MNQKAIRRSYVHRKKQPQQTVLEAAAKPPRGGRLGRGSTPGTPSLFQTLAPLFSQDWTGWSIHSAPQHLTE